jgi:peroxiredoxin
MTVGTMYDPRVLPDGLPPPIDDGAAAHLPGQTMPALALPSTSGGKVRVDLTPDGYDRLILYAYPLTGIPGVDPNPGWNEIPGARGCTPEACGFRDHASEIAALGAAIAGVSTQSTAYQCEVVQRLQLPFPLLSDGELKLTNSLRLPTFRMKLKPEHDGGGIRTLLKRLTLIVRDRTVERVFYPVFPPDRHAEEVLAFLHERRRGKAGG